MILFSTTTACKVCARQSTTGQNLQLNVVKHGAVFIDVLELVARRMCVELISWLPIGHEEFVVHSRTEQVEEAVKHICIDEMFLFSWFFRNSKLFI